MGYLDSFAHSLTRVNTKDAKTGPLQINWSENGLNSSILIWPDQSTGHIQWPRLTKTGQYWPRLAKTGQDWSRLETTNFPVCLSQLIILFKSFHMDSDGQMVNGDINPSLMVLFGGHTGWFFLQNKVNLGYVLCVSRPIYVNVDSPNLGFPYF